MQFTHILDFMVMMPLGEQLMRELSIGPGKFSHLVAAYTISAGVVGLITAPFMDRFGPAESFAPCLRRILHRHAGLRFFKNRRCFINRSRDLRRVWLVFPVPPSWRL